MQINPYIKKGLAVGIILLFVGTCIIPSTAQNIENRSVPTMRGNWLYVGGSGPGNYSKIQDAIDNASDGDTVFVFHNKSPYRENIVINKSINLMGENNINTVILGEQNDVTIQITADKVKVSSFNIKNPRWLGHGISISSDFNIINDNNLSGFYGLSTGIYITHASHNSISNNIIDNTYRGNIVLINSSNNLIFKNIIRYTNGTFFHGGYLEIKDNSQKNIIFRNLIERCDGFFIWDSNYNIVYENSITNCTDNNDGAFNLISSNLSFALE